MSIQFDFTYDAHMQQKELSKYLLDASKEGYYVYPEWKVILTNNFPDSQYVIFHEMDEDAAQDYNSYGMWRYVDPLTIDVSDIHDGVNAVFL
tara:strand:+ start:323 stop:598 length:276 start_codon:yes stop_codon:yes gene_type:complete